MTEYRVGIVHVPYQLRGGEDSYVEMLHRAYSEIGIETAALPEETNEAIAFTAAWKSLRAGNFEEWDEFYKEQSIDFLHLNNIHPLLGPAFLRWIIARKIPTLMTVHNHRFYCTNGLALYGGQVCKACRPAYSLTRPVLWNCNGSLAKSSYHALALKEIRGDDLLRQAVKLFLSPSQYISGELEAVGLPAARIRHFPHSVDISAAKDASPSLASDIVFIARLTSEKGLEHLLAAASLLPERKFAIVGDGPQEEMAKEAAAVLPNIRYHGKVSRGDALAILRSSKVACVPSVCLESFSLVAAEALCFGLKLVVPNTESFRHFTAPPVSAVSAEVRDARQLAAALEQALASPAALPAHTAQLAQPFSMGAFQGRLSAVVKELVS